ncbi:MAG: protoporphyrinogen oxidase, partial [Halothiobacillaceae bacterium]|nr:protoporphyrinogen oxidase [Halothiobacillaceae bacterium]
MNAHPQTPVLVIGAGISGLATAYFLHRKGVPVRVLEAAPGVGGCVSTLRQDGWLIERGPNSTLDNTPALGELIRALGLEGAVLEANPLAKRRYVVRKGKTLALPGSPLDFLRTPLFSAMDKLRLLKEPFVGRSEEDETLAAFVRRRLGPGFLDW